MRYAIPFFVFILFASCSSDPVPVQQTGPFPNPIRGKLWMSNSYDSCIAFSCPCECLDSSRADWVIIDSVNGKWLALMCNSGGCDTLTLKFHEQNITIASDTTGEIYANFEIEQNGELTVEYQYHTLTYTNIDDAPQMMEKNNLARMNAKSKLYHIPPTDTLLVSLLALDSTQLYCDSLGRNVIYTPELEQHKYWFLELNEDSLVLYEQVKGGTMKVGTSARNR